ncbi:lysin [Weissella diestrammenae]|uniref:Lysin n=1 Tax=Weissella diestrammenae TaxID=1162633 RepID=A0A7G9T4R5_9LACO|nr:GH25 family lysozyme [Weissella diestrammenae]MCM0582801.1 lysin [Weissella diestrammenae]QNN75090.1 lysin [Weissella diestrammenae]
MKINKFFKGLLAALFIFGFTAPVSAAVGDHGVDWAVYQGDYGKFGYAHDKFSISQIGGYTGAIYDQSTYKTQVQSSIAQGKRAHTYIWWQNVTDNGTADYVLNYFLPKVQTPKGSIVALDVESGWQNTDTILYALQRIKDAGYTPLLYGYKNFLVNNTDLNRIADSYGLWLAEYPNYEVTPEPNYNYFPSFKNVQVFQFTSTYIAGGLDGNVDLTGVTDNGYTKGKPDTDTPAIDAGQGADDTSKKKIDVGTTVKVNFGASHYATGELIPDYIKGVAHKVIQRDGNRVLLDDIYSWVNVKDVEILDDGNATASFSNVYVLDSWQVWQGRWYGVNNDMSVAPIDYNNYIPATPITMTDRFGNRLSDQSIHGNNGVVEFFTLNGNYQVLERSGAYVKLSIDGEPVWLKSAYVN